MLSSGAPMLLATKFHIPVRRHELVVRPRLLAKLQGGLNSRLILVSSPPGFGKTTLITQWLAANTPCEPAPAPAWLALDEGDNDPARFFAYFSSAVLSLCPAAGDTALPATGNPELLMTELINTVAGVAGCKVLVLDDYHVLHTPVIHQAITYFIEHMPASLHLVISSRADPPLPLARWRARRDLTEVRAADLRFRVEEAHAFLADVMGMELAAPDVATLEQATEGWVAGLQLAALSLQDASDLPRQVQQFAGTHTFIGDYLTEEVLQRQPADIQQFLMDTSILKRLSGALCNAVTGRTDAAALLTALDRGHLFLIPLDDEHVWYRYHHLFAEMLHSRLAYDGPERVRLLHRRAAEWYLAHDSLPEAIDHALAADAEVAADLIERHRLVFQQRGEYVTLMGWLRQFPDTLYDAHPRLCLLRARAHVFLHDLDEASRWLAHTRRVLDAVPDADPTHEILTSALNVECDIALNRCDLARAAELGRQSLALIPPERLRQRSEVLLFLGAAHFFAGDFGLAHLHSSMAGETAAAAGDRLLAVYGRSNAARARFHQGLLHTAAAELRAIQDDAVRCGDFDQPLYAGWHVAAAKLACEWNELDRAEHHVQIAQTLARRAANPRTLLNSLIQALRIRWAQARWDDLRAVMTEGEALTRQVRLPPRMVDGYTCLALRVALALGDQSAVRAWLPSAPDPARPFAPGEEPLLLALARVWLAQGASVAVLDLLARLQTVLDARQSGRLALEVQAARAVAQATIGAQTDADATLADALGRAQPEGYIRLFVDEGEPMRALLRRVAPQMDNPALRDYAERLLSAFPAATQAATGPLPIAIPAQDDEFEALSPRELEVLRLVDRGLSDRAVAEELVVVTGTVKRHLSNIYDKLGVRSRTQALARARSLGLLVPTE